MQVTEAWIAIEINNGDCVIAYGPFDTRSEVMTFASGYNSYNSEGYDGEMVVRKLRRPPYPHLWRSRPSAAPKRNNTRRSRLSIRRQP
jgi:hypothetical protein